MKRTFNTPVTSLVIQHVDVSCVLFVLRELSVLFACVFRAFFFSFRSRVVLQLLRSVQARAGGDVADFAHGRGIHGRNGGLKYHLDLIYFGGSSISDIFHL